MTDREKKVLLSCPLFEGIGEKEKLLHCLQPEEACFEKNQIIWNMGDRVQSCAVILSGAVRAESVNPAGEHSLMARHGAGSLVGDVLMSTPGGTSPVYVIASQPVTLIFLSFSTIMGGCSSCCPEHLQLRENLIAQIARKFWSQRQRMQYLSLHSLRGRIAAYLLDRGKEQGTAMLTIGGTREDLADFLCVNRSALSRELGRMKQEGLIDFYRETFRILNPDALHHYAP